MNRLEEPAILVVDMLNDFVTGSLTCDRVKAIVPATARLLEAARQAGVPVIFCNDAHLPGIDRELKIWGDHAYQSSSIADLNSNFNLDSFRTENAAFVISVAGGSRTIFNLEAC